METIINELAKVKPRNAILIEGLPGIGNVGRVAAEYLASELKMKKIAELYSPHFLPLVIIENSATSLLKNEFYYHRGSKNDFIVLTGDTQSISPEGHYEVCEKILDYGKKLGVKSIITLGGFAEAQQVENPRVIGAVNDEKLIKKYSKFGIDFNKEHSVSTIVGASGVLLGLAKLRGIDGICLMGETIGIPMLTDPRAADKVLQALVKTTGIKISLSKLEKAIKDMEQKISRTEKIHKSMLDSPKKDDQIKYIG